MMYLQLSKPDVSTAGGPQVNKFEQAFSADPQMSLARGLRLGNAMSDVQEGWGLGVGGKSYV